MKKLVFLLVLVGFVLLIPFGVKKYMDNKIQEKKVELSDIGIDLTILKDSGYFESNREYEIKINDIVKFQDFIKVKLAERNLLSSPGKFDITKEKDVDNLKKVVFRGDLKSSNILPTSKITSTLYLASLPKEAMNDKEVKTFIENKSLSFDIAFSVLNGLDKVTLKDLEVEKIFKLLGTSYTNKSDDKKTIKGLVKIDEISLLPYSFKEVAIQKINLDFEYKDYFNNSSVFVAKSIALSNLFKINNIYIKNNTFDKGESFNGDVSIKIDNFNLKQKRGFTTNFDKLLFNMNFKDFNKKSMEKLDKLYNKSIAIKFETPYNFEKSIKIQEDILSEFFTLLNNGFNIDGNLSFEKIMTPMFTLNKPSLDFDIKLDKNNLTYDLKEKEVLKYLDLDITLKLKKEDYKFISLITKSKFDKFAKFDKDEVIFNIKTLDHKIKLNGKALDK